MRDVLLTVLSLSVSGTLVALVLFLLKPLYRKRLSKGWQYYVWLVVLARLVLPFAPAGVNLAEALFTGAPEAVQMAPGTVQGPPPQVVITPPVEGADNLAEQALQPVGTTPETSVTVWKELYENLWIGWLGVALVLLVRKVTSYHSFARFIRAGWKPVDDPQTLDVLDDARQAVGVKRTLALYHNPLATSPMLVGIFRPVIVLPDVSLPADDLRLILMHEMVHYRRMDILYKWITQIVVCIHWFNPIVYLMRREINRACELSCDERVLARMQPQLHTQYGNTLLVSMDSRGSYGDLVASVTMSEEGNMMKERLQAILHFRKRSAAGIAVSILLTIALLSGAAFAGSYTPGRATQPPQEDGQETQQPDSPEPIATALPGEDDTPQDEDTWADEWEDFADSFAGFGEWFENADWERWIGAADSLPDDFTGNVYVDNRWVSQNMYYQDGYIIGIRYDSTKPAQEGDMPVQVQTEVTLPAALERHAKDEAFLSALRAVVVRFAEENPTRALRSGHIRVMTVDGPYAESPDTLLERFYAQQDTARFAAMLPHVSEKAAAAVMDRAVEDQAVASVSLLLSRVSDSADFGKWLDQAYAQKDVAVFSVLLSRAPQEARDALLKQAVEDGRTAFSSLLLQTAVSIDALVEQLQQHMDTSVASLVVDKLTPAQADSIGNAAFAAGNAGVFSIVRDAMTEEAVASIYSQAVENEDAAFIALIGD